MKTRELGCVTSLMPARGLLRWTTVLPLKEHFSIAVPSRLLFCILAVMLKTPCRLYLKRQHIFLMFPSLHSITGDTAKVRESPRKDALKHDALAIFDALRQTAGDRPVIVFGRSLGTALAAYTAARRSVQLVIILTPFDSIAAVGQGHYPWLPVRLLLQHDFDVCADARRIHATTLFLIAEEDRTTPPPRAHSIMQEWAAPKTSVVLEGARHNDIIDHPQYWTNIATFLSHSS